MMQLLRHANATHIAHLRPSQARLYSRLASPFVFSSIYSQETYNSQRDSQTLEERPQYQDTTPQHHVPHKRP